MESKFSLKMADQNVDVAQLFQGLALQLNNLTGTIESQGASAVSSFCGETKGYKDWFQNVETLINQWTLIMFTLNHALIEIK